MSLFFNKLNTLFICTGESNSGGVATISQADATKVGARPSVMILNNTTFSSFDILNIGSNNLILHQGLSSTYSGTVFGFEYELAKRSENPLKPYYNNPCYLVKTGQGGSVIANWSPSATFGGIQPLAVFTDRVNAAKSLMPSFNYKVVILYSQGINDAIAGSDIPAWKTATIAHFARMRAIVGYNCPIIMTEFQGMGSSSTAYDAYSQAVRDVAAAVQNVYSVNTAGATRNGDNNHWDGQATGMPFVTGKMLDLAEQL